MIIHAISRLPYWGIIAAGIVTTLALVTGITFAAGWGYGALPDWTVATVLLHIGAIAALVWFLPRLFVGAWFLRRERERLAEALDQLMDRLLALFGKEDERA